MGTGMETLTLRMMELAFHGVDGGVDATVGTQGNPAYPNAEENEGDDGLESSLEAFDGVVEHDWVGLLHLGEMNLGSLDLA